MSLETRRRVRTPYATGLTLPPPFRLVTLREAGDAFAHAARQIAADEGAGTLVHVGRFDLVEFALVLEPDEPLRRRAPRVLCRHDGACRCARRARAAGKDDQYRLARTRSSSTARWSAAARLAWPDDASEDAPPDWLVFGATVRVAAMEPGEPGLAACELGARGRGVRGSRRRAAGRELRAPSHGADRCLAGAGVRRSGTELPALSSPRSGGCAATSTRTAISWCGRPARPRWSAAG